MPEFFARNWLGFQTLAYNLADVDSSIFGQTRSMTTLGKRYSSFRSFEIASLHSENKLDLNVVETFKKIRIL